MVACGFAITQQCAKTMNYLLSVVTRCPHLLDCPVLSWTGLFILEYVLLDTFSAAQFSSSLLWWTWNSTGSSWKHDITGAGGELGMYHFFCKRKLLELPFGGDKEIQGGVHCKRCRGDLHRGSCKSHHTVGSSICEAEVGFLQLIKRHKRCKNKPWSFHFLGSKCVNAGSHPGILAKFRIWAQTQRSWSSICPSPTFSTAFLDFPSSSPPSTMAISRELSNQKKHTKTGLKTHKKQVPNKVPKKCTEKVACSGLQHLCAAFPPWFATSSATPTSSRWLPSP